MSLVGGRGREGERSKTTITVLKFLFLNQVYSSGNMIVHVHVIHNLLSTLL